jgi:hypothetical protein
MGKDANTPAAPDYTGAAIAQGLLSREAALSQTGLNRPNEVGPFGSRTWSYTPSSGTAPATGNTATGLSNGNPLNPMIVGEKLQLDANGNVVNTTAINPFNSKGIKSLERLKSMGYDASDETMGRINPGDWTVTTTLSPEQQRLYDQGVDYQTTSGQLAADALTNYKNMQPINYSPGEFSGDRSRVENAVYDRATRLYGDQFSAMEGSMRDRLVNQGLDENSEAFQRQVRDFENTRYGAYQDAADRAVIAGGQEQSRLVGDESRLLANLLQARGSALNEAQALASGGKVNLPNFQSYGAASGYQAPDMMGATQAGYNAALGAANAENAADTANTQGGIALASMLAMYF